MKKSFMMAIALAVFLLPCLTSQAQLFVVTLHGSRSFQKTVNGGTVISSQPVTNEAIYKLYGVTAKDHALVYNASFSDLELDPFDSAGTSYAIIVANTPYTTYNASSPKRYEQFGSLRSFDNAEGPDYAGLTGVISLKESETPGSVIKGVSGTIVATATSAAPYYLYTISFSGSKLFKSTP